MEESCASGGWVRRPISTVQESLATTFRLVPGYRDSVDVVTAALAGFLSRPRLARAPIMLYRRGLGRLLGNRMLMLEHRGRTSGQARYVVLEVVDRPAPDRLVVASGFGTRAQWYRNLAAEPRCRVSTGRHRELPATATLLDEADSRRILGDYQRRNPAGWERLKEAIESIVGHPVEQIPLVELQVPGLG